MKNSVQLVGIVEKSKKEILRLRLYEGLLYMKGVSPCFLASYRHNNSVCFILSLSLHVSPLSLGKKMRH